LLKVDSANKVPKSAKKRSKEVIKMSEQSYNKRNKTVLLISKKIDITNKGAFFLIKKSVIHKLLFYLFILGIILGFVLFKLIYVGV